MLIELLIFAVGIGLLVIGAWLLVEGGTRVAGVLGVPPVVVGLTVVAFGTSAPELFVSLVGALRGSTGLVLGNVIGSNVANLGLILGAAAVLRPVVVEHGLSRREVPMLMVISVFFCWSAWDGVLTRVDAGILVVGFVVFLGWTLRSGDRGSVVVALPHERPVAVGRRLRMLALGSLLVLLGIVGLAGGGQLIVSSALSLAIRMGISETLVGLTLVAVGTSLPELATTLMAAWRNQDEMALGNIIGSNIFNTLAVAGPVGLIKPLVDEAGTGPLQMVSMFGLTFLVFVMIVLRGGNVGRLRGAFLLLVYVVILCLWTVMS